MHLYPVRAADDFLSKTASLVSWHEPPASSSIYFWQGHNLAREMGGVKSASKSFLLIF